MTSEGISIRLAKTSDFRFLAAMERSVWGKLGTDVYDETYFQAWIEVSPDGFFVAEQLGVPIGFAYVQTIKLEQLHFPPHTTFNQITDRGYTACSHTPNGNYRFGLTVCSLVPGAGWRLMHTTIDDGRKRDKPILGVSRLADFASWVETIRASGHLVELTPETEASLALHYTLECVRLQGGRTKPEMYHGYDPARWPQLTAPDDVLKRYLRQEAFCLIQVVPDFWTDLGSRNFTVLFGAV